MATTISVLIDLPDDHKSRRATLAALEHAAAALDIEVDVVPLGSAAWERGRTELGDGVVVGPGSPYEVEDAAYSIVELARTTGLPLVGT